MSDIFFNIACKELKIAQIAQLNQLFQLLHLGHTYSHGIINNNYIEQDRDLSVASRSIICPTFWHWQIIDLRGDSDKSRYFGIIEFNNIFKSTTTVRIIPLNQSITYSNGFSNHISTELIISLNPEITDKVVLHYHSES